MVMAWWRHNIKTLFVLLTLCEGNTLVTMDQLCGTLVFSVEQITGVLKCHRVCMLRHCNRIINLVFSHRGGDDSIWCRDYWYAFHKKRVNFQMISNLLFWIILKITSRCRKALSKPTIIILWNQGPWKLRSNEWLYMNVCSTRFRTVTHRHILTHSISRMYQVKSS